MKTVRQVNGAGGERGWGSKCLMSSGIVLLSSEWIVFFLFSYFLVRELCSIVTSNGLAYSKKSIFELGLRAVHTESRRFPVKS